MAKRTITRRCEHCSTYYQAHRERSKYCSDSCRVMAYKSRHGIPLPDFKNLSAIQQKFQSPEATKVRDLSNELLVLVSRRHGAEAEYERYRQRFERADKELRERIEKDWPRSSIERSERERDEAAKAMQDAGARLSEIDRLAAKLQEQLATANDRLAAKGVERSSKTISSKELRTRSFDVLPIEGEWEPLLGRPERGFLLALYGTPFSGKSSLCLRLLGYLCRFGSCLYISAEEGISESFKRKVQQWLPPTSEVTISNSKIPGGVKRAIPKFDFVVIDSIQATALSVADLDAIIGKKTSVIGVLQSTKDGSYRGGADYIHLADIVWAISIADNKQRIEIEKNRFL
jgi:hypothetical protein